MRVQASKTPSTIVAMSSEVADSAGASSMAAVTDIENIFSSSISILLFCTRSFLKVEE